MSRPLKPLIVALLGGIAGTIAVADEHYKTMPPDFTLNAHPQEVLRGYPLGIITEQDAFVHHGAPIRKVPLPNGNAGWLYKIGESVEVPNVYVLEFSKEGRVVDVLHKDHRFKLGHSALQYQYLESIDVSAQVLGPGPNE